MTKTILLATCAKLPGPTPSDQILQRALEQRGVPVAAAPWDQVLAPDGHVVVLRSTWDYHIRIQEFRAWLDRLERGGIRVLNPIATVRWNLDKRYLLELEAAGIAIPPTRLVQNPTPETIRETLSATGWGRGVLKPLVSATAFGTAVVEAGTPMDLQPMIASGAMLQAFVAEVLTEGELSLMFFGGQYSHAVRKRPRTGDFRVQADFGGSVEVVEPDTETIRFAERVLEKVGHPWVYARADLVQTGSGPVLMELELIEPHLFFDLVPAAANRFADSLLPLSA